MLKRLRGENFPSQLPELLFRGNFLYLQAHAGRQAAPLFGAGL
jgi:hypothetical protein